MRTPGPWDVDISTTSYAAAIRHNWNGGRHTVCYVEGPGLGRGNEGRRQTGVDNARLIAAAPDLLDACMEVANGNSARAAKMVRAAIAKAMGQNDRVEGRDAALSRRVPSHDGLCGNGTEVGAGDTAVESAPERDIHAELTLAAFHREVTK